MTPASKRRSFSRLRTGRRLSRQYLVLTVLGGMLLTGVSRSVPEQEPLFCLSMVTAGTHQNLGLPPILIEIDNSEEHQQIEGFGASMHSLVYEHVGDVLEPALRAQAMDAVYNQVGISIGNLEGIFLETPAGWDQRRNDNDDPFETDWNGFRTWTSHVMKEKVIDLGEPFGFENYFLGVKVNVRWASPWLAHIRSIDNERYLEEATERIVAAHVYWRDEFGIVPRYQMPFNEPLSGNGELLNGNAHDVLDIIKRVGARLSEEGFAPLKFIVPNEETEMQSLTLAQVVLSDPEARRYVGVIGYHPYPYGSTYGSIPEILRTSGTGNPLPEKIAIRNELRDLGREYGIPVWMTEVSHGAVDPLSFDALRGRAIHIHDEFVYADAAAYFGMMGMWDTETQRMHFGNDNLSSPSNEGNIVFIDTDAEQVHISGIGYAIGHYARWIEPGAIRIGATSSDRLLQVTAFRDEDRKRLVLVLINNSPRSRTVQVELNGLELNGELNGEQSTVYARWQPLSPIGFGDPESFAVSVPGESVTTVVGQIDLDTKRPKRLNEWICP